MHRRRAVVLSVAIAIVATLGSSGCSSQTPEPAGEPASTTSQRAAPRPAELPAPRVLAGVLERLGDPAIPGTEKLNVVEGTTAADAAALDRFANALRDNGYTPPILTVTDVVWSESHPTNADATVTVNKPGTDAGLTIPMEFAPYQGGWQLSEESFDMLLNLGKTSSRPPPPEPPR